MIKPRYLLDTDICIYISKHRPPAVREKLDQLSRGMAVMSTVTWGELHFGATMSDRRDMVVAVLAELAREIPVVVLPRAAAECYGEIRGTLTKTGGIISQNDLWIAAHALAEDLVLVTNNTREFSRVPDLRIENWVAPG